MYIHNIRYSAGNSLLTVLNDWKIRAKLSIHVYTFTFTNTNITSLIC